MSSLPGCLSLPNLSTSYRQHTLCLDQLLRCDKKRWTFQCSRLSTQGGSYPCTDQHGTLWDCALRLCGHTCMSLAALSGFAARL